MLNAIAKGVLVITIIGAGLIAENYSVYHVFGLLGVIVMAYALLFSIEIGSRN